MRSFWFKVFIGVFTLFLACIFAFIPPDDEIIRVFNKLKEYNRLQPQEKLYIHLDKPLYAVGEDLWFKAYLINASFYTPDTLSKVLYVELLDESKKILIRRILPVLNGFTHGDIHLEDSLKQGNYIIRAYTNHMKNLGEEFFFLKEISILNPNSPLTQSADDQNHSLDLQFFPEGGNVLSGVENRIAFKAINSIGRGVDVEGVILDEKDNIVVTFKSEHLGMGMLKLNVSPQKKYGARIKNPYSSRTDFPFPDTMDNGYLLRVTDEGRNLKVTVYTNAVSEAPMLIYLLAQSRSVPCFVAKAEITKSSCTSLIPKNRFPSGITQITVFNEQLIPQCERLIFINHHDDLQLTLGLNKNAYKKRDSVSLELSVRNFEGQPVSGNFSLSIYDEAKIKDKEKFPATIVTHLLLTSDLKGSIEEPGYYFKDNLPETLEHLDHLMMTQGWRRFAWKDILQDTLPSQRYAYENGITLSGQVFKSLSKKPAGGSQVKVFSKGGGIYVIKTDPNGYFYIDSFDYYDSTEMVIQTDNVNGKQADLNLKLNPFNPSPTLLINPTPFNSIDAKAFINQNEARNKAEQAFRFGKNDIVLKEVLVEAKRKEPVQPFKIYGTPDQTIKMSDQAQGYSNILQAIQGRVAGVWITGAPPNMNISIRGGGTPLFLVDGMPADLEWVMMIPTSDVETIDILKSGASAMYGSRGGNGVIAIYTKRGGSGSVATIGINHLKYPGFYKAREFYSPTYHTPLKDHEKQDIRSTLYWNPAIKTNLGGKAQVSFYTSDISSKYKIVIEGLSNEGFPGIFCGNLDVQ